MENLKAKFHLPGITGNFKLNLVLITMLENCPNYFREGVEIASCYGAFAPSVWAGGRVLTGGINSPDQIKTVILALNERGIPLRFTFTNPLVKTEHLGDSYCNMIMQLANNGMNEVIVSSDILEDYIRNMYPNYKITSSTCKRITEPEKLHEELEKNYNLVVVDYDLNNKWNILENLPHKEKCEFLLNSSCFPNCPKRSREYETIGKHHIDLNNYLKTDRSQPFEPTQALDEIFSCPATKRMPFEIRKLPHHISPDAIWNEYIPKGFNQFKIEGRGAGRLRIIESYMYYLIKPEYRDEAYFMFMHNLERNGVVKIDNV
ncbi:MAG: hypothetical protein NC040_07860 [Muribaculaceae bacterium]|nr:hypothetical protein [Alistipes senegalensis]MCM1473959.1 hypothetical protein [Muribaculaceae bacterium]